MRASRSWGVSAVQGVQLVEGRPGADGVVVELGELDSTLTGGLRVGPHAVELTPDDVDRQLARVTELRVDVVGDGALGLGEVLVGIPQPVRQALFEHAGSLRSAPTGGLLPETVVSASTVGVAPGPAKGKNGVPEGNGFRDARVANRRHVARTLGMRCGCRARVPLGCARPVRQSIGPNRPARPSGRPFWVRRKAAHVLRGHASWSSPKASTPLSS